MECLIHIDTIGLDVLYFKVLLFKIAVTFLLLSIVFFIFENSANPDKDATSCGILSGGLHYLQLKVHIYWL